MKLKDKIAVITGGTRGLGLSTAEALAKEGTRVVVSSRSQDSVDKAVEMLTSRGYEASGITADVGDLLQVQGLARHAVARFGGLDIWVNNAGVVAPYGPSIDIAPQDFYRVVQTNIIGVYHGSRTALHYFNNQNSGKLINILGLGDSWAAPWQNTYAASKAWMRSYTKALAAENKGSGVSIIAFNPGMTRTSLLTDVDVIEGSEERLKVFPKIVRMWSNPPEVPADKIAWLASSATDGRTGLYVSLVRPGFVLRGLWKELKRAITGNHSRDVAIKITTIPPSRDD